MKISNFILIFGGMIVAFFAYRWYSTQDSSYEPLVTLLSSVLVVVGYFLTSRYENKEVEKSKTRENKFSIGRDVKGDGNILNVGGKVKANKKKVKTTKTKVGDVTIGDITGDNNEVLVSIGGVIKIDSKKRIDTPIPRDKINRFISLVTLNAMEYEKNPGNPPSIEGEFQTFLDETVSFSNYQKQKPLEVAMSYRIYSSIYMLHEISSGKNWDKAYQSIKNILKYSVQLFEENLKNKMYENDAYYQKIINKFPQFKDAVNKLEVIFKSFDSNRITPEIFKEVTLCNLTLAMPTKDYGVIENMAARISQVVTGEGGATTYTPHFNFLIHLQNSNHQELGESIKLLEKVLTLRNSNDIHYPKNPVNPYYYPNKKNGLCRIEYDYQDSGRHIELHWDVSVDRKIVNPLTPFAKVLMEYWGRNFISLESLKVLLDNQQPTDLLNSSIADIKKGDLNLAIIKLMKLKIIDSSLSETHFHLGVSLYGAIMKFSSTPKMVALMQKMQELQRLPVGERDKKFQEFLKSSDEGEFQELNRVMTGEYPFWSRDELTQYLNKSPNGEFATQAKQILQHLANVLPKN